MKKERDPLYFVAVLPPEEIRVDWARSEHTTYSVSRLNFNV